MIIIYCKTQQIILSVYAISKMGNIFPVYPIEKQAIALEYFFYNLNSAKLEFTIQLFFFGRTLVKSKCKSYKSNCKNDRKYKRNSKSHPDKCFKSETTSLIPESLYLA